MSEIKNVLGVTATIFVFIGYIPYLRDITQGKTKPHVFGTDPLQKHSVFIF